MDYRYFVLGVFWLVTLCLIVFLGLVLKHIHPFKMYSKYIVPVTRILFVLLLTIILVTTYMIFTDPSRGISERSIKARSEVVNQY